jgi:hypothetical protein
MMDAEGLDAAPVLTTGAAVGIPVPEPSADTRGEADPANAKKHDLTSTSVS